MWYRLCLALAFVSLLSGGPDGVAAAESPAEIVCPAEASELTQLAARELRRYVYLRTDAWMPIVSESEAGAQIALLFDSGLAPDAFRLKTAPSPEGRSICALSGGSDVALLYAAYRFAEVLGVRFYIHGDTIPDAKIPFALPDLDENHAPSFALRGIQPFHDFPEGPDWWSTEHYKAIVAQLPKLRMNFLGLHTYPEDRPAAEPTTWIGMPEDVNEDGSVKKAYPAIYYNTALAVGWGFQPKPTSQYACGAAALFDRDDYGSEIMCDLSPKPETDENCVEVFRRTGAMFKEVFSMARDLGVKTCIGTETPLVVPKRVAEGLERVEPVLVPEGGTAAHFTAPVEGTEDDALFQHVRYNMSAYRCALPNGTYTLSLCFVEPFYDSSGVRVFGVRAEGQPPVLAVSPTRAADGRVFIKLANPMDAAVAARVTLAGLAGIAPQAELVTLAAARDARNDREQPARAAPATSTLAVGADFTLTLPPTSVQVLTLQARPAAP